MMQTLTGRRELIRTLSLAVLTLLVAGCSPAPKPGRPPAGPAQSSPSQRPVVAAAPPAPPDLALRLEALLGEHSVLAAAMMPSRTEGNGDLAPPAHPALRGHTGAMTP